MRGGVGREGEKSEAKCEIIGSTGSSRTCGEKNAELNFTMHKETVLGLVTTEQLQTTLLSLDVSHR